MATHSATATWAGASLKRTLSGKVPVMLVHRSHQNGVRLPEVVDYLASRHGSDLGLGTVMRLPAMTVNTARTFAGKVAHVPLRIVDPELWRIPHTGWPEATALKATAAAWPHLHTPAPAKVSAPWVKTVLNAQRDHGATVLLSATGWVSEVNAAVDLRNALKWVEESRRQVGDAPMWVNLTLDSRWLSDRTLRNILLNEIVESNERDWYLRFYWPEVPTRYGQLLDDAILAGYQALARECMLEDKRLYLPNSGLTGWFATALGANGFSTGQAWPEQAFARQKVIAIKRQGPPPAPIPRIFDSTILHTMDHNEFERIRPLTGHKDHATPYLDEIDTEGHSPEVAGLHYLAAVGNLTAILADKRPNAVAYRRARKGQAFVDSLSLTDRLSGINRPLHLPLWIPRLK
jgi:hypothetical protein